MRTRIIASVGAVLVIAAAVLIGVQLGKRASPHHKRPDVVAKTPVLPRVTVTQPAPGTVSGNGAATFLGRASNAVVLIQWTRAGASVTGTIQENYIQADGEGVSPSSSSFSGTISGNGLALQLGQSGLAGVTSLTGQLDNSGFQLTFPGANAATPIQIPFTLGTISSFTAETDLLNDAQYGTPCTIYLSGHAATVTFTGPGTVGQCAAFVASESSYSTWSTSPSVGEADGQLSQVCQLQNAHRTRVTVQDAGGLEYGTDVCNDLNSDGQWVSVGDLQPASAVQGG